MVQSGKQFLTVEPLCVFFRFVNLQTLREMMGTGDFVDGEPWDITITISPAVPPPDN